MKPDSIPTSRLYKDLAHFLPLLCPREEFAEEAACWLAILREKLGAGRHEILELGVGGGCNLSYLTSEFEATAVDVSEPILEHCRRLNPNVKLQVGDMRTVRLGRKFAAVLIHDAICYMLSEADLAAAFETAAEHLQPGGVFIVSPEYFSETFKTPVTESRTYRYGAEEFTYFEYIYDPDPQDTTVETLMFYLLKTEAGLQIELDRHVTGIFPKSTWNRLLTAAFFSVAERRFQIQSLTEPYYLFVGVL